MRGNGWLSNINSATDFDFFWLISKHSHIQYSKWMNKWMNELSLWSRSKLRKHILKNCNKRGSKTNTLWETCWSLPSIIYYITNEMWLLLGPELSVTFHCWYILDIQELKEKISRKQSQVSRNLEYYENPLPMARVS